MNGAIKHFNHHCVAIAHPLSSRILAEHPVGFVSLGDRSVSYASTQRDGEPVLAYHVGREGPFGEETYCEVTARGMVIFRASSSARLALFGEPYDSTMFYENEVAWLTRAASAGIPEAAELLAMTMKLQMAHLTKHGEQSYYFAR